MRYFLIMLEKTGREREIDILHSTNDEAQAVNQLIALSDKHEESSVAGRCRVYMTTYIDNG